MQRKIHDESRESLRRLLTACNKQQFGQIRYSYDDCAMEFATATSFLFNKYTHTQSERQTRAQYGKKTGGKKLRRRCNPRHYLERGNAMNQWWAASFLSTQRAVNCKLHL